MPIKAPQLFGGDVGVVVIPDPIGFLDNVGHSHISDPGIPVGGNSTPDQGMIHKIDGLLQPAIYRNAAVPGARLAWHNQGNCADGDGGWAQVINEFTRDEAIWVRGATTTTATTTAGVSTSVAVTARDYFFAGEWVAYGTGSTMEVLQLSTSYVAATGAGSLTFATAVANTHASGEPIYSALRNSGYLAKSVVALIGVGINDLGNSGPRNTVALDGLVFGTNVGASRGMDPFKHALRGVIAHLRCTVVYRDTHPSCIYGGTWVSNTANSAASYPLLFTYSGTNAIAATGATNNYHSTTTASSTVTVTTAADFPGGAATLFFLAGTQGAGALWNFTVNGSATPTGVTFNGASSGTGAHDNRAMNAANENEAAGLTSSKITLTAMRIAGLAAGVNTIVATAATITTTAFFIGWGLESSTPPWIGVMMDPRVPNYTGYTAAAFGYGPRSFAGAKTATVSAGAGTAAGSVTLGSAITTAVAGTQSATATQPGDTITIGTGATQETRRIVAIASTTTVSVNANFTFAHTGETCVIGLQDADIVGGGYANLVDTAGATAVPGYQSVCEAVAGEFDSMVQTVDLDPMINSGPGTFGANSKNFGPDGLHYNDQGASAIANNMMQRIGQSKLNLHQIAFSTVSNRRTYIPVYGDSGVTPAAGAGAISTFMNGWSNYYTLNSVYPKTAFYKDMRTRMVHVRGAIFGGSDSQIWSMPLSYLPEPGSGLAVIPGWGTAGPGALAVLATGVVGFISGYPGTGGFFVFGGSYFAAGA